ncbi:hypothetical protein Tsubulata_027953 [Turnera subulata]|uniref:Transmembrane protein n=1 Tax=Turnera subulata TaxID=218843 RepID=A0A9Q0G6W8_9ROSI|nr:hypothetical protein Tsubulata_027953 [Turnera subulata]
MRPSSSSSTSMDIVNIHSLEVNYFGDFVFEKCLCFASISLECVSVNSYSAELQADIFRAEKNIIDLYIIDGKLLMLLICLYMITLVVVLKNVEWPEQFRRKISIVSKSKD